MKSRRGFTMIELLVGMVIFAIVGTLFTKMLTTQGRFFDRQGMTNAARNVSRSSLNRVVSDFRMIESTGGVVAATPTSLTIRIPFAIGVVCANSNGRTHISILPVDSMTYAKAGFYGFAWRNFNTGAYTYVEGGGTTEATAPDQTICTGQNVSTVTNGKVVMVQPSLDMTASGLGTPVFLYARVRYEFKASQTVAGMSGLYRTQIAQNGAETSEEIVAPFANTAKWKFFTVNGGSVAQDAAPANLADLRGLELHLDGMSENRSIAMMNKESAPFTTAVFFKNRLN